MPLITFTAVTHADETYIISLLQNRSRGFDKYIMPLDRNYTPYDTYKLFVFRYSPFPTYPILRVRIGFEFIGIDSVLDYQLFFKVMVYSFTE